MIKPQLISWLISMNMLEKATAPAGRFSEGGGGQSSQLPSHPAPACTVPDWPHWEEPVLQVLLQQGKPSLHQQAWECLHQQQQQLLEGRLQQQSWWQQLKGFTVAWCGHFGFPLGQVPVVCAAGISACPCGGQHSPWQLTSWPITSWEPWGHPLQMISPPTPSRPSRSSPHWPQPRPPGSTLSTGCPDLWPGEIRCLPCQGKPWAKLSTSTTRKLWWSTLTRWTETS